MMKINNEDALIRNGENSQTQKARAIALQSLEQALNAADPGQLLKKRVSLKDSRLCVNGFSFDLTKYKNIYVIGGGKAGGAMAEALEELLGKCISEGVVNVPYGTKQKTSIIKLHEASHPIPDQAGVQGTMRIMEIAEKAEKDDLVICLVSGGGSSLMPLPPRGISLGDKKALTRALLMNGAAIGELNVIRKHLSAFKGGWLAKKAYPATVLNLILSDVVGDPLDSIASGPTVPDSSTFADAKKLLEKYHLWATAPSSVRKVFSNGVKGLITETPKFGDPAFEKVTNVIIGNNRIACQAAVEYLRRNGLNVLLLADPIEGEAKRVGKILAKFACEIATADKPLPKPAGIVAGGETTVKVKGKGKGGRNQELALSTALELSGLKGCVVACLSTDGVDGPTEAAGAIGDCDTFLRATRLKLEPKEFLANNDSYHFFSELQDLIITGQTGTNVNDISVIVVL